MRKIAERQNGQLCVVHGMTVFDRVFASDRLFVSDRFI